jgi:hypothetical protein
MPALFLLAAIITVLLALVFVGFLAAGIACCFIRRLKFLVPYLLLVPTLSALGAGCGSWGLGYLTHRMSGPMSVLPFWGYVVGLPLGGALGFLIGFGLARFVSRNNCAGFAANADSLRQSVR